MESLSKHRHHWLSYSPALFPVALRLYPEGSWDKHGPDFVKSFWKLDERVRVIGKENIPEDGPVYFIAEHRDIRDPPFVVASVLDLTGRWPRYIMRDNFFGECIGPVAQRLLGQKAGDYLSDGIDSYLNSWSRKYLHTMMFPRDSMSPRKVIEVTREAQKELNCGGAVAICPSATRSKDGSIFYVHNRADLSLEGRIHEMGKRAYHFVKGVSHAKIVPVGVTLNTLRDQIYINFGEPIEYGGAKDAKAESVHEAVKAIGRLKVIGMNQLIPYYIARQDQDLVPMDKASDRLTVIVDGLKRKHRHFDDELRYDAVAAPLNRNLYALESKGLVKRHEGKYSLTAKGQRAADHVKRELCDVPYAIFTFDMVLDN